MRLMLACAAALSLALPTYPLAHGGGLNHCGCHIKHATGECHCHRPNGDCSCACNGCSHYTPSGNECEVGADLGDHTLPIVQARSTRVRGYTTKRGTYVAPHYRSSSNPKKSDNYSTKGNANPYTGKKGTKKS